MKTKSVTNQNLSTNNDPYARFEATKRKNFSNSSRLEGITQSEKREQDSLESVLEKYRVS